MEKLISYFRTNGVEESLFLLMSFSVLLPFYIGSVLIFISTGYLMYRYRKDLRRIIQNQSWVIIFILYSIGVAIYFRNYIGIAVSFVLLLITFLFSFYYRSITANLFIMHLKIFVGGSIFLAFISFWKYTKYVLTQGYDLLYIFKYHNPQTRAEATFFNPNYYGLFIAMVIIMAIYLFVKLKRPLERWLSAIAIVLNLISLILTASRWSIPTVIVGIVLMVFFLNPKISWLIGFVLAGGFLTLFIKPDLLPRFTTLAHAFDDRFAIWYTGWRLFLTSPIIGRGSMTYVSFYYLFVDQGKMHTHQLLIDTLANYGLTGLMLLVMAFSQYFRSILAQLSNQAIRLELGLLISVLVTVLFHGIMDVGIFWIQTGYILLIILVVPFQIMEQLASEGDT